MFRFILSCLLAQTLLCIEFPDLGDRITMNWADDDLTGQLDGSRTVSDASGNVAYFILCGAFKNAADEAYCTYDYEKSQTTPGNEYDLFGSGFLTTLFLEKLNETDSCIRFGNPIGEFKELYEATLFGEGDWNVSYICTKAPKKWSYKWLLVLGTIVVSAGVIAGGVFGLKYLKKRKMRREGNSVGDSLIGNING